MLSQDFAKLSIEDLPSMDTRHGSRRSTMVTQRKAEFSRQSIVQAMDEFVNAVQEMEETILVPSRLLDLPAEGGPAEPPSFVAATDLRRLHHLIQSARKQLLWGADISSQTTTEKVTSSGKGHARRPSTVSSSSSLSDTDSEAGLDSGVEAETESTDADSAERLEADFRHHLFGLQRALSRMTDAASYLTRRYQHDVGPL